MLLLLLSATEFEISKTVQWLNNRPLPHNASKPELLISGIGQLQAAYTLQKQIHLQRPDLLIQAGIGGALSPEDTGKVYAIRSERMADLGVMENAGFRDIFDLGLEKPDHFPFREGKLTNPYRHLLEWTGLPLLDGITVNEIKSADYCGFQQNQLPVVESMEGAALHYIGLMENIPFLQIRSVSNVLGERDKTRWKMMEALENLHEALVNLIQKLEKADETLFRI
jgi:futalosine hydrolase